MVEGVLSAKHHNVTKYKKNKNFVMMGSSSTSTNAKINWRVYAFVFLVCKERERHAFVFF